MKTQTKSTLKDGLLIVFSVLFALLITSAYESYQTYKKKNLALEHISSELENNSLVLDTWIKDHTSVRDKISRSVRNPQDSLVIALKKFDFFQFGLLNNNRPLISSFLNDTAWETSKSTGIIGEFNFETAENLTQAYKMQTLVAEKTVNSIRDYYYSADAQNIENLDRTLMQFMFRFYELTLQEETLKALYEDALALLDKR